jgi:CRP-like cAMP-binding protein
VQNEPDQSVLEPLLHKLCYRVDLDAEDRAAVLALPCAVKTVERHHFIVRERELATCACVMLSGFSIRSKLTNDGRRQIVAIQMKGEAVDLQNSLLTVSDHSVQMLTPGKIAIIPREAIIALTLARPRVGHAMWIDTLVDGSIFREWIMNVGRRDAKTRLAHLLCEFALRLKVAGLGDDTNYELPMTQEQLADTTGLTPVHVNRSIKALEQEGLIRRLHPRAIHIGDWRKLADAGDFDSNYLHLRADEPALA